MRLFFIISVVLLLITISQMPLKAQKIDIQGHRGARGLMPENTIPGFLKALDYGVTTLELDVVVSGDSMVIVSHEPYFSADICLDEEGNEMNSIQGKKLNIYEMTYEEITRYDCGSKPHPQFPEQEKTKVYKPLLEDVIKETEIYIKSYTGYEVDYNIEIKSSPAGDDIYHPSPERFSDIVYQLIDQYLPWDRVIIQSFDFRVLKYWHQKYPEVRLAALIDSPGSVSGKLSELGFQPEIYSPHYRLINKEKVEYLNNLDIKVIPWTVNDPKQMIRLYKLGVDGIITDYPDRAEALGYTVKEKKSDK